MSTYCIYHKADHDGQLSGFLVKKKLPHAIMIPYQYGDDLTEHINQMKANDTVYVVDVSLTKLQFLQFLDKKVKLYIFDHHQKSASELLLITNTNEKYRDLCYIDIDYGVSSCYQVYLYLYPSKVPELVQWISDYDSWHLSEDCLQFHFGLLLEDTDPLSDNCCFEILLQPDEYSYRQNINSSGACILEYLSNYIVPMYKKIQFKSSMLDVEDKEHEVSVYNTKLIDSYVPELLGEGTHIFYYFDGDKWKHSIRGAYSSKIAQRFGGNGHETSAGFVTHLKLF